MRLDQQGEGMSLVVPREGQRHMLEPVGAGPFKLAGAGFTSTGAGEPCLVSFGAGPLVDGGGAPEFLESVGASRPLGGEEYGAGPP